MSLPLPSNEIERLKTLRQLAILDTDPEKEFDDLAWIAAQICEVPIAAISLIDTDRQWFKSIVGLDVTETSREAAFCSHTILGEELFIVPNACEDERFAANPLVTGDPNIRFYAGAPLITEGGQALGSLCVIDRMPRQLRPEQQEILQALARQTMRLLALRRQASDLAAANQQMNREISGRETVEKVLRLREQAIAVVSEGIVIVEKLPHDNEIIYVNASFESMTGYTFDEVRGRNCRFLQGRGTDPATVAVIRKAIKQEKACAVEILNYRKDGTPFWNALSISPVKDEFGRVTHFVGVQQDITERRRAAEKLRMSEERYRLLSETVPQQVWTALPDGRINYGNSRTVKYFGKKTRRELFNTHWTEIIHPDDVEQTVADWTRAVQSGEYYEREHRLRRSDGTYRWHLAQAVPMIKDGEILKWLGTNTDIHDRKLAEEAARQSVGYRNLFQNANDAIIIFEPETENVIDVNEKACRMYGIEREEFLGKSIKEMSHDVERGANQLKNLLIKGTHQSFETVQYRANGTPLSLLINSSVIEYQGKKVVLSINRDVSGQKKAQRALQESREQYQQLFDSNPHPIWVYDTETLEFLAFNNEMVRRYGYSRDVLSRMTIKDIRPPEDVPLMLEQVKQVVCNKLPRSKLTGY